MLAHIHSRNILFSVTSLQSANEILPLIKRIYILCTMKQPVNIDFKKKNAFQWDAY